MQKKTKKLKKRKKTKDGAVWKLLGAYCYRPLTAVLARMETREEESVRGQTIGGSLDLSPGSKKTRDLYTQATYNGLTWKNKERIFSPT